MFLTFADIFGSLIYIATMFAAFVAARLDRARSATPGGRWFHWAAIAALFAGLAVWRLGSGEERVQTILRGELIEGGQYASRYAVQGPAIAVLVLLAAALCSWAAWHWLREPTHRAISGAGAMGLLAFSLLRLISYHPFDQVIYASLGPVRLNYLIELGLIGMVSWGAFAARKSPRRATHSHRP